MNHQKTESASPPQIPARIWKIAAVTGAGAFMAMLDSTVANLAIESILTDFAASLPLVQWVVTAYLIALAVSLPSAGWLGSRYGFGRVWTAALAAFVISSAICGLALDPQTLIGARFLQGLAAGLMVPAGQAVLGATAAPNQLGRLMGMLGLVVALGPAVGPAVGGFLLKIVSWRWLFWINVPFGLAALHAAQRLVPPGATDADRRLDHIGLILLGLGLPLLLYGGTEIGSGRTTTITVAAVLLGGVLAVGFVFHALDATHPLLDLRLFGRSIFTSATVTTGLTGANMYGGLLLLPLYLQLVAGQDVAQTGMMLLAMGLGSAGILPVAGGLTDRHGAGRVSFVGAGLLVITTILFLLPGPFSTLALSLILVARGMGLALAQMPAMTAAYASVTTEQMGDAATLVNIVQRVGGAFGAITLVIVITRAGGSARPSAYTGAFVLLATISAFTLISAAALRRRGAPPHI